jgi:sulfane dehydrogenase subunit SoxC
MSKSRYSKDPIPQAAGNGLLDRRALLGRGVMLAGAMGAGAAGSPTGAAAEPLAEAPWSLHPGNPVPPYQRVSRFEDYVVRTVDNQNNEPGGQRARTPHQLLNGIITPNGLHFTIVHSGIPDIDPAQHKLVIHGLVRQPLAFTLDGLSRYSMVSRIGFTECGGNSAPLFSNEPIQANLQALHGLASCAEWTGVPLATLLDRPASTRRRNGSSPRARIPRTSPAACRSRRSWTTPWSRSTRTASASSPARAIRCGCGCPATKAT